MILYKQLKCRDKRHDNDSYLDMGSRGEVVLVAGRMLAVAGRSVVLPHMAHNYHKLEGQNVDLLAS